MPARVSLVDRRNNLLVLVLVILIGLSTRINNGLWPEFVRVNAGDALWAVAVYVSIKIVFTRVSPLNVALIAVLISFSVEFSQLLDINWLNTIRETLPGKLLLGTDFIWIDLVRYSIGIVVVAAIDKFVSKL